ncbi:hypothetical protein CDL15_Pgr024057 [Punica granatum]|uniref:RRM domain-containing protein n=1 Tax=Punica granatum TaxID=22663 RepID=A0A218XYF2_PUNGR|nr:hypothetical protein CDL15_Pgr024057 [Punica granatum]
MLAGEALNPVGPLCKLPGNGMSCSCDSFSFSLRGNPTLPPSSLLSPVRSSCSPKGFQSSTNPSAMSSALDMSLDDLIKNNKKSGSGNPRARGRGSGGPGPARRPQNRAANRAAPYAPAKAPETTWQHDMYSESSLGMGFTAQAGRASAIETGTKLYISNLDYGVSNDDVKELFAEVGDIKRYSIHYDRSGRSKGTAEVVFSRRIDAVAAVKRYNNVQLDGKPMKIEIVGTNIATPAAPPLPPAPVNGAFGASNGILRGVSPYNSELYKLISYLDKAGVEVPLDACVVLEVAVVAEDPEGVVDEEEDVTSLYSCEVWNKKPKTLPAVHGIHVLRTSYAAASLVLGLFMCLRLRCVGAPWTLRRKVLNSVGDIVAHGIQVYVIA